MEPRSYDEVEKRRQEEMTGGRKRSVPDDVLMLVFLVFTTVVVYFLVVSWAGMFPAEYPLVEGAAGVAALSLFAHRLRSYGRGHSALGALAYALGDVFVFGGVLAAVAWVFVFPVVHPVPGETVAVGVVSLVLISAMVVVLRFVQPVARTRPDRDYSDIESSMRKLEAAVTHLSGRLPQGESRADSATLERLSTMMSELEAMRKEFSTLRSTAPPPGARPSTVVYAPGGVRTAPDFKAQGQEQVAVAPPASALQAPQEEGGGRSVPDSTVGIPWLEVLARRRAKHPAAEPPEQGEQSPSA